MVIAGAVEVVHDRGMTSHDLNVAQAERLGAHVRCDLRYLNRLCERMIRLGFPPKYPLYVAAVNARAAMQDLFVAASLEEGKPGRGTLLLPLTCSPTPSGRFEKQQCPS